MRQKLRMYAMLYLKHLWSRLVFSVPLLLAGPVYSIKNSTPEGPLVKDCVKILEKFKRTLQIISYLNTVVSVYNDTTIKTITEYRQNLRFLL
jgi:hypothetical protein